MEVIVRKPTKEEQKEAKSSWGIWEKEASEFPWSYNEKESCLIIDGNAEVTCKDGKKAIFGKGDFVQFPEGFKCTWKITKPIKKYYKFG